MKNPGNTLAEYGFIAAIVMVASIGLIYTLGGNISDVFRNLKADLERNTKSSAWASIPKGPNATGPGQSGINGVIPAPGPGQQQVCYQSGWCVNIPTYGAGAGTTGALGGQATSQLADVLEQIRRQMEEAGAPDDVIDRVTAMANTGHGIAHDQGVVDLFISRLHTASEAELHQIAAQYGGMDNMRAQQNQLNDQLRQLNDYLNANPGAFPPEMRHVINAEIGQINQIMSHYNQDQYISNTEQLNLAKGMTPEDARTWAVLQYWHELETNATYMGQPGSAQTTNNANTICSNGGNISQCLR